MMNTILDSVWLEAEAAGAASNEMSRYYDVFASIELHLLIERGSLDGDGPPQPVLFLSLIHI